MTEEAGGSRSAKRAATLLVAALAVSAYLPSLSGGFVSDDERFIVNNDAIHSLGWAGVRAFFTDPGTQSPIGGGTYRPLRTLDFAIDWAIAGNSPFFFRIRSLLYHLLASLAVLALLRRLAREVPFGPTSPAALGAMLFAVHPANTEVVAWVSSRGDLLCLLFFVTALVLHLDGRRLFAAALLVPALFAKEAAVVFLAAAFLSDLHLRRKKPWAWYAAYAVVTGLFVLLWYSVVASPRGGRIGQTEDWFGGSWAMNAIGAGKGFLYDLKVLVFPVDLAYDWFLPIRRTAGLVDFALAGLPLLLLAVATVAGRRSRFAALWFLVTILPVSGLVWRMMIPTADRFLLLPSVGFCLWAGGILRRTSLRWAVLAACLVLCIDRSLIWRSPETLWDATLARADTPNALAVRSWHQIEAAMVNRDPVLGQAVVDTADRFLRLYREDIHLTAEAPAEDEVRLPIELGGTMLARKAMGYLLQGRWREALDAAWAGAELSNNPRAHEAAGVALERLGQLEEAAFAQERAIRAGLSSTADKRRLAELFIAAGAAREAQGDRGAAADFYRRALLVSPSPDVGAPAQAGLERVKRP